MPAIRLHRAYITLASLCLLAVFRPSCELQTLPKKIAKKIDDIQGIDVSHYQGKINWSSLHSHIDFVLIKATEGNSYIDPMLNKNTQGAKLNDIPWAYYHFYRPSIDPIIQAKHFLKSLPQHHMPLRPVLDIEVTSNVTAEVLKAGVTQWLQHVASALDCKPLIYASRSFYDDYLGAAFNDYDYWLAEYNDVLTLPKSREHWLVWQYSEKGRIVAVPHVVDRDRLNAYRQFNELKCSDN